MAWRSASHWARMASASARRSASSRRRSPSRSALAGSVSLAKAASSISRRIRRRVASSSSAGIESISVRSLAQASSTRSMALSGRKRSEMYRWLSTTAATRAASWILTPWNTSRRSRRPRRMEMASSTVGSSTKTGWKRRSRAASFSMWRRYSSTVVAPIMCSSPRASIGLSMLPASMAPSAAPAPTTVCSSSTNSRSRPSAALTSESTAFRRSSNSPRYLAPATSDPMSRAKMVLSRSPSGTSPRRMRWASPSTMAVLPTPGSPIRTGLFLVFRDRIWTTRRISESRPMTGSSLPARASATRSRPYFSRAS